MGRWRPGTSAESGLHYAFGALCASTPNGTRRLLTSCCNCSQSESLFDCFSEAALGTCNCGFDVGPHFGMRPNNAPATGADRFGGLTPPTPTTGGCDHAGRDLLNR